MATNDKTMIIVGEKFDTDFTTNVPYTTTGGTVTCSGIFQHYTDKKVEKIKYEVSTLLVQVSRFCIYFVCIYPRKRTFQVTLIKQMFKKNSWPLKIFKNSSWPIHFRTNFENPLRKNGYPPMGWLPEYNVKHMNPTPCAPQESIPNWELINLIRM